eukprot:TRINITY_DN4094_c3_g1_i2.p2 TRINITY_DN4094_c3_g1~~TRINITY_DN4094_c3_g1_i2.p2  ORF type:complete len:107 (-),score=17.90 TRINITY_DN4094_c3_g1_i2:194-514(-)
MADSIRNNPSDALGAQRLYLDSLTHLNKFFQIANGAMGMTPDDEMFLPLIPAADYEIESEEYWWDRRKAWNEANDPVKQFQERNAFGTKEMRNGLKRFPGATLLLR